MKSIKGYFAAMLAGVVLVPLFHARSEYLRVANLLPIQGKPVDLYRGSEPYMVAIKPGYFQNYLSIPSGGNHFVFKQGGAVIGEFTLPAATNGYFTTAVYQDAGKPPQVVFYSDELKKEEAKPGEPPPPPKKRLRLYLGGYDFPIKLTAKPLGEWTSTGNAQFLDVDITGSAPEAVVLEYKDRYDQMITMAFPTDFTTGDACSVFVS
ncbi:MAG: hypothetical protein ACREKL_07965, partial [Chthoniobacterales bacterium]